jgi:hypothetical protein
MTLITKIQPIMATAGALKRDMKDNSESDAETLRERGK